MEQKKEKKYSKKIGLWINEKEELDKFGNKKKTISGNFEGERIALVKNEYKKEGSKEPDYYLLFYPQTPKVMEAEESLPF